MQPTTVTILFFNELLLRCYSRSRGSSSLLFENSGFRPVLGLFTAFYSATYFTVTTVTNTILTYSIIYKTTVYNCDSILKIPPYCHNLSQLVTICHKCCHSNCHTYKTLVIKLLQILVTVSPLKIRKSVEFSKNKKIQLWKPMSLKK